MCFCQSFAGAARQLLVLIHRDDRPNWVVWRRSESSRASSRIDSFNQISLQGEPDENPNVAIRRDAVGTHACRAGVVCETPWKRPFCRTPIPNESPTHGP